MDEEEVGGDEDSENEVEADCFGLEVGKKDCESDEGEEDGDTEGAAVTVMEVVAGFEVFVASWAGVEETRVHQAIGGVEHPDGEGHGKCRGEWKLDVVRAGDEPRPESGDCWCVEGEQMPERERIFVADRLEERFGLGRGRHLIQFIPPALLVRGRGRRGWGDRRAGGLEASGIFCLIL